MKITPDMLSIIIPAKNEARSLATLLPELKTMFKGAEIIVVNDGSTDMTREICENENVQIIYHPYSKGNGAAIKSGARSAKRQYLLFMDGDGQHKPQHISRLLDCLSDEFDMVVGARERTSQSSNWRWAANILFCKIASWMVGHKIPDLTSGLRIADADKFRQFIYLLPNGFSYPTTITMAFFRAGYSTAYVNVPVEERSSRSGSHIRPLADGMKFLLIIMRVATLYSPLKTFIPISGLFFILGLIYAGYTLLTFGRFTNFGGLLFITSMLVFLIGLVSEQITTLLYSQAGHTTKE